MSTYLRKNIYNGVNFAIADNSYACGKMRLRFWLRATFEWRSLSARAFVCVAGKARICGMAHTGGCRDTPAVVNQIVDFTCEVW